MTSITRFAPSPTGYLHAGHALSALFAAHHGDTFLLRIEDIDRQRCKPVYETAIYEDLTWLGLTWQHPVRRQSDHFADYQAVLDSLGARGLLYPCFCTRSDIARAGGAPQGDYGAHYPGTCKHLTPEERCDRIAQGDAYALRLNTTIAWQQTPTPLRWHDRAKGWQLVTREQVDDVVLARSLRGIAERAEPLMPASYHLCVTCDDAWQGVTLVTRGEDLFGATPIHRLLQSLLGFDPPDYHHHPLLMDHNGKRLAKRDNAPALAELRAQGMSAQTLITTFAALLR